MRVWFVLLAAAGCGRLGFDARGGASGGGHPLVDSAPGGGADGATGADASPTGSDGSTLDSTSCDDVHAGALFCDGFEGAPVWTGQRTLGASVAVSSEKVYRGTSALRMQLSGGTQAAASFYASSALGGLSAGSLYIRGYFYIPSGAPATHLLLLWAGGTQTPTTNGLGYADNNEYAYGENDLVPEGLSVGVAVPRDKWTCLEMEIDIGNSGHLQWWVDGAFAGGIGGKTLPSGGFERFEVGVADAPATQASIVMYADEVIANTTRIGCD